MSQFIGKWKVVAEENLDELFEAFGMYVCMYVCSVQVVYCDALSMCTVLLLKTITAFNIGKGDGKEYNELLTLILKDGKHCKLYMK
jgi:hypothetical protein